MTSQSSLLNANHLSEWTRNTDAKTSLNFVCRWLQLSSSCTRYCLPHYLYSSDILTSLLCVWMVGKYSHFLAKCSHYWHTMSLHLLAASLLSSECKRLMLRNIRLNHMSVCLFVCLQSVLWQKGWLDPDAVWVVSGVGWGMGVLNGWWSSKGRGSFGGEFGLPIVTNWAFATQLFSNYFEDLLL